MQQEIVKVHKSGNKEVKSKLMESAYSAALEVIIHATRHIFHVEKVDINDSDRVYLINRIVQVKQMFEKELNDPALIGKKQKTGEEKQINL